MSTVAHPHKPNYKEILAQVKARKLSEANAISQAAVRKMYGMPANPAECGPEPCIGQLDIGFFFDGTGNNKEKDCGREEKPHPFLERKHSNVVAFMDNRRIGSHAFA
jgi:hypothetical protein